VRGDQDVELSDGCSSFGKHATDTPELGCRSFVEGYDFDGRRKCVD
jgi:hypothetical protein